MGLTHIDERGNARMVDVSPKAVTAREAVATGRVSMKPETLKMVVEGNMPKGDVFSTARIAGIMAAKRTQELIPMCHNVPLDDVTVELSADEMRHCVDIKAVARCTWKTGVEMEALTAVSVAGLAVYDMCKAVDKEMVIGDITLIKKSGGKSGDYIRKIDNI
ncbi:MAG TPA: cyclic pyranopterin monophosphate synthase MoaC [Firmicutes bacterium]|jgi:cyclic pyranopterin monophosphate synthase|nr:cyclic pyranopterin monophosphate synthase MoaC [Bacillota bacterium]